MKIQCEKCAKTFNVYGKKTKKQKNLESFGMGSLKKVPSHHIKHECKKEKK